MSTFRGEPRQYDLDIIAELRIAIPPANLVVITASSFESEFGELVFNLEELEELNDAFTAVAFVLIAQIVALSFSLQLGMTPDNPFPGGAVNRVVRGVHIHSLTGA